jgi:hypothetical protein
MQNLAKNESALIELIAGQVLFLEGEGIATSSDVNYTDIGVSVSGWPVTVGPLAQSRFITITSSGNLSYEVREDEALTVRWVSIQQGDLPENGKSGVIYETEAGAFRFDVNDGTYKALDDGTSGATLAPVNDTAPVIAGEAEVDAVLTLTSVGVWDYRPTDYTYQWTIDDVEVEGATSLTFVVPVEAEGLDVKCEVTATNWAGSATEASNAIAIPA